MRVFLLTFYFFFDTCRDMIRDVSVTLVPLQGFDRLDATDPEKNIKKVRIIIITTYG